MRTSGPHGKIAGQIVQDIGIGRAKGLHNLRRACATGIRG